MKQVNAGYNFCQPPAPPESEPQPSLVNQLNGDSNDIGIMSAAQLRKEILSVRLQLERERDLRLKAEMIAL